MSNQIIGNTEYNAIKEKAYINGTQENIMRLAEELDKAGINYSGRVSNYRSAVTVEEADRARTLEFMKGILNAADKKIPAANSEKNIIGNAEYRYIPNKRYVKGETEAMLRTADRLTAENISFSGRINGDTVTITVSGDETQELAKKYFAEEKNRIENIQSAYFLALSTDTFEDGYYFSEVNTATGEEIAPYRGKFGDISMFLTVDEAEQYARVMGITLSNTDEQLNEWRRSEIEAEKEKERQLNLSRSREMIKRLPMTEKGYEEHFVLRDEAVDWIYFNPDGANGEGQFVQTALYADDILEAYKASQSADSAKSAQNAFIEAIQNGSQSIINADTADFEFLADVFIKSRDNENVIVSAPIAAGQDYDNKLESIIRILEDNFADVRSYKENHITETSKNITVEGHIGIWNVIDSEEIEGKMLFLLESEYGDETANIIVDGNKNIVMAGVWNGFDDYRDSLEYNDEKQHISRDFAVELWENGFDVFMNDRNNVLPNNNGDSSLFELFTDEKNNTFYAFNKDIVQQRLLDDTATLLDGINSAAYAEAAKTDKEIRTAEDYANDMHEDGECAYEWSNGLTEWQNFSASILSGDTEYIYGWLRNLQNELPQLENSYNIYPIEYALDILNNYEKQYANKYLSIDELKKGTRLVYNDINWEVAHVNNFVIALKNLDSNTEMSSVIIENWQNSLTRNNVKFIAEKENSIIENNTHTEAAERDNKKTLIINAFGGPGAGKSTACLHITSELKKRGFVAEYVSEYAKDLVWDKNFEMLDGSEKHQKMILEEQKKRMDRLIGQVDFVITDAPILLNSIYLNSGDKSSYDKALVNLFNQYDNFNLEVIRDVNKFEEEGRIHNLKQSQQADNDIRNLLNTNNIYFGTYSHGKLDKIVDNAIVTYNKLADKPVTIPEIPNRLSINSSMGKYVPDESIPLSKQLYELAKRELTDYENSLDTAEKAKAAAYELSVKRDILSYIEYDLAEDVTDSDVEDACRRLISTGYPLDTFYRDWLKNEYDNRMEAIRMTAEDTFRKENEKIMSEQKSEIAADVIEKTIHDKVFGQLLNSEKLKISARNNPIDVFNLPYYDEVDNILVNMLNNGSHSQEEQKEIIRLINDTDYQKKTFGDYESVYNHHRSTAKNLEFTVVTFEDDSVYVLAGKVDDNNIVGTAAYEDMMKNNFDIDKIEDLNENIKVEYAVYRTGDGEAVMPTETELAEIRNNLDEFIGDKDPVSTEYSYLYPWKNVDDILYGLEKLWKERHNTAPQILDDSGSFYSLLPDSLTPSGESGGVRYYDTYSSVKLIKLKGRDEWLDPIDAAVEMNRRGVDLNDIEMLDVNVIDEFNEFSRREITPEQFAVYELQIENDRESYSDKLEKYKTIVQTREAAHNAGLPFREAPADEDNTEDFNPYVLDGTMSPEDYELMHKLMREDSFEIYQVKSGEEYHNKRFAGLSELDGTPNIADYDLVFSGSLSDQDIIAENKNEILEAVFTKFNNDRPEEFKGHSLSVSDIVVLHKNDEETAHYVDTMGFSDVPEFLKEKIPNMELLSESDLSMLREIKAEHDRSNAIETEKSEIPNKITFDKFGGGAFYFLDNEMNELVKISSDGIEYYAELSEKDKQKVADKAKDLLGIGENLPYQVITYDNDAGSDEKGDFPTLEEAQKSAIEYLKDNYDGMGTSACEGYAIYNKETQTIEETSGYFPSEIIFSKDVLIKNGITTSEQEPTFAEKETSPLGNNEALVKAVDFINEYSEREFGDKADFSNMAHIDLGYTTDEETDIPIEVYADLDKFKIVKEYGGKVVEEEKYDSLEDMNLSLKYISFDELTALSDEQKMISQEITLKTVSNQYNSFLIVQDAVYALKDLLNGTADNYDWKNYAEAFKNVLNSNIHTDVSIPLYKSEAYEIILSAAERKEISADKISNALSNLELVLQNSHLLKNPEEKVEQISFFDSTPSRKSSDEIGFYSSVSEVPQDNTSPVGNNETQKNEKSFAEQVDDVLAGNFSRYNDLKVCDTPKILLDVGCEQLPMMYTTTHLRDALKPKSDTNSHFHGLTTEQIKDIPNQLIKPAIILDSVSPHEKAKNSIIAVLNKTDNDNAPIIVSIVPNGKGKYELEKVDSNFITSIYGKDNGFEKFITTAVNKDMVLYWNKQKSQELFSVLGLQLPKGLNNLSSDTIIHQSKNIVNTPKQKNIDYTITDKNYGAEGGAKTRFANNVAAIKLLKEIESENRTATPEEQEVLAKYVGWGGIPEAFDSSKDNWKKEYTELKNLLTDEEYIAARASTLNAHYTSPAVINAIYSGLESLGFDGGKILEPAMGIGNFFGAMPENIRDNSKLYGVELDSITGRIAKLLYPSANVQIKGYEKTDFTNGSFDVAVGNVPFGGYKVNDKDYNKQNFFIHDYFFAKTLDKVRAGGIIAFVTSKGTLDKESPEVRKYLAERAELLGAIRLPNNAFKANAGTEVTSDIIFLQKRERPISIEGNPPEWIYKDMLPNGIAVNKYFADHPEMILGEMVEGNKLYGNQTDASMCVAVEGADLEKQLAEAVKNIKGTYIKAEKEINDISPLGNSNEIPCPPNAPKYSFIVQDDILYYHKADSIMEKYNAPEKITERIKAMVQLRDSVHNLLDLQLDNTDGSLDKLIAAAQQRLNDSYDNFSAKYGLISSAENRGAFRNDNSYHLIKALEKLDKDGNFIGKADIFSKITVNPKIIVDHCDNAQDALILSLSEKMCVNLEYMSILTGKSEEELIDELGDKIFQNPQKHMRWESADEYLTGNVRQKLAAAEAEGLTRNAEALRAVMPKRIEAADIAVKLGSAWVDPDYIRQFIVETLKPDFITSKNIEVTYMPATDKWKVEGWRSAYSNTLANETYGTYDMNAYEIIEATLNMQKAEIRQHVKDEYGNDLRDSKGRYVYEVNQQKTMIVQAKQDELKRKFADWIFSDPDRREKLVDVYNEKFNSVRLREYDGSHLNFVGMNSAITLKEHQKNAVARGLYSNGNTLLAHEVGAGKTYEMIAIAMEGKRLGLHHKSLITAPNGLTEQWGNAFRTLYPNANVLVATEKDFQKENRRDLFAKIATGDWDAVIIGHSQFDMIHLSRERELDGLYNEIGRLEEALREMNDGEGKKSFSVKQIEKSIKTYQDKVEKLLAKTPEDDMLCFEKLGVDKIFVDESQAYKNLDTPTKMRNVSGIGSGGSGRSMQLLMKCKYLDEITGGKGCTFASGTPISNSMSEMYTLMRYLQADKLADCGINSFDRWASVFGETTTAMELSPEGNGKYHMKTRFAKFQNLPELMNIFKECADIKTAESLDLDRPDFEMHNVNVPATAIQSSMIKDLGERARDIRAGDVDPTEDNMCKLTVDGRKIGLDQRCMNPNLPDDPKSKVNVCINNVFDIWQKTAEQKSTQLIFCDLATPQPTLNENTYTVYRKNEKGGYSDVYSAKLGEKDTAEKIMKKLNGKKPPKNYEAGDVSDGDIIMLKRVSYEEEAAYNTAFEVVDGKLTEIAPETWGKLHHAPTEHFESERRFCVYDDIKQKLVSKGVPEKEIAFIHDADKAEDKQKLYDKMNKGEIRVLIGSTSKCGAGMNAQERMIALHDLDAPMRPSDMEQRHGRIIRQGNTNSNVDIYRYTTDKTFDAYLYQMLENKQRFISQIMTDKSPVRSCEDVDEVALDYAEVKALCAGNPLIREKIDLETAITKLNVLKSAFLSQKYSLQDKAYKSLPEHRKYTEHYIEKLKADIEAVKSVKPLMNEDGKNYYPVTVGGKEYHNKEEAGQAIRQAIINSSELTEKKQCSIGSYRGFEMIAFLETKWEGYTTININLKGACDHGCEINMNNDVKAGGNIIRLDNVINGIALELQKQEDRLQSLNADIKEAEIAAEAVFPQEQELTEKEKRLAEVNTLLTESDVQIDNSMELYAALVEICPELESYDTLYCKYEKGEDSGIEPLIVEKNGDTVFIAHTYVQNGDLMYDPAMEFSFDTKNHRAQALSYELSGMGIYEDFRNGNLPDKRADAESMALDVMFENIKAYGYERTEFNAEDREAEKEIRDGFER